MKITVETEMTVAAQRSYAEFVQVDATRQVWLCERMKSDLYKFTSASVASLLFVPVTPP